MVAPADCQRGTGSPRSGSACASAHATGNGSGHGGNGSESPRAQLAALSPARLRSGRLSYRTQHVLLAVLCGALFGGRGTAATAADSACTQPGVDGTCSSGSKPRDQATGRDARLEQLKTLTARPQGADDVTDLQRAKLEVAELRAFVKEMADGPLRALLDASAQSSAQARSPTSCQGWRQTGACDGAGGPREQQKDLSCEALVAYDRSGYCECLGS